MAMKRLPAVLVLLIALAVPAVAATAAPGPAAHAAKEKQCTVRFTEGRTAHFLRVSNVSCGKGRAVATRVISPRPSGCVKFTDKRGHVTLVKPCVRSGFRCTSKALAQRLALEATCKDGARVVKFQY